MKRKANMAIDKIHFLSFLNKESEKKIISKRNGNQIWLTDNNIQRFKREKKYKKYNGGKIEKR